MNSKQTWIEHAIELGKRGMASGDGGPFGCVIVRSNRVVAEGWNRVLVEKDPTAHAEVVAIRKACAALDNFQLTDCELYTSCEPCPMCLGAIYWARPSLVVFSATRDDARKAGFDDEMIYREIALPPESRKIRFEHLPSAESGTLFDLWIRYEKRQSY